jgi:hypothetical protein
MIRPTHHHERSRETSAATWMATSRALPLPVQNFAHRDYVELVVFPPRTLFEAQNYRKTAHDSEINIPACEGDQQFFEPGSNLPRIG